MNSTEAILEQYGPAQRDALIPILQAIQQQQGYLSREAIVGVGRHLNLPTSKIYGVATFYNQFTFQPKGRFHIQVCRGTACHVKGSAKVLDMVERELKIKPDETTSDGLFSLEVVACIGACGLAPVICVNGKFHANMTCDHLKKILAEYRSKAKQDEGND